MPAGTSAPSATSDPGRHHRAFADPSPIQHNRPDANQRVILDRAAMQHRQMPHRHAIPNRQRNPRVAMQHRTVLNARLRANLDMIHVPANGHVRPNAGARAYPHVANHNRARVDISGDSDARSGAAKRTNHVAGVDFMLTRGLCDPRYMRSLLLLCFALVLRADESTQKLADRLAREAEAFEKSLPN